MREGQPRVVVIGGGIIGTSIALELTRRGAEVTLLEATSLGSATTSTSYAWLNANGKEPLSYYTINRAGIEAHQALANEVGTAAVWHQRTGHLEIATDTAHEADLRRRAEVLAARGNEVRELTVSETRRLEPALNVPDTPRAILHFPEEGYIYPLLYVAEIITRLRAAGGRIVESARVVGFESAADGVTVLTQEGPTYLADQVVVAAGRGTPKVVELAGGQVPLAAYTTPGDVTVGYLARTNPLPVNLSRVVTTPWLNARPEGGGRLVIQALDLDATADPNGVPTADSDLAREFLSRLQTVLYGSSGARIDELLVGQRVMPADGKTISSPVPGVEWMYAVATHSGVTLAPYLGRAVAGEILGDTDPLLEEFRLSRFADGVPEEPPRGPRKPGEQ